MELHVDFKCGPMLQRRGGLMVSALDSGASAPGLESCCLESCCLAVVACCCLDLFPIALGAHQISLENVHVYPYRNQPTL